MEYIHDMQDFYVAFLHVRGSGAIDENFVADLPPGEPFGSGQMYLFHEQQQTVQLPHRLVARCLFSARQQVHALACIMRCDTGPCVEILKKGITAPDDDQPAAIAPFHRDSMLVMPDGLRVGRKIEQEYAQYQARSAPGCADEASTCSRRHVAHLATTVREQGFCHDTTAQGSRHQYHDHALSNSPGHVLRPCNLPCVPNMPCVPMAVCQPKTFLYVGFI